MSEETFELLMDYIDKKIDCATEGMLTGNTDDWTTLEMREKLKESLVL